MSDKDDLLEGVSEATSAVKTPFRTLMAAYIIVLIILAVTIPKIYISNEIYYTSRDIAKLRGELGVLKEENRELKSKLEKIRYKNQIIDNMN